MKLGKRMMTFALFAIFVVAMTTSVSADTPAYSYNAGLNYDIVEGGGSVIVTQYYPYTTIYQEKDDDESHYLLHTGNLATVGVASFGSHYATGRDATNTTYRNGQLIEGMVVQRGIEFRFTNWVNESGYHYCALAFYPTAVFSGTLEGYWHPTVIVSGLPVPSDS